MPSHTLPCAALALLAACSPAHPTGPDVVVDATDAVAPPADARPALAVERVEDLGAFPLPSTVTVGRDGTSSGVIAGRVLWTFGDTFVTERNPTDDSNVISATAGWSTPGAPLALEQPTDDAGFPAQFIPYTADELAQNRAAPLDGWALWPGAVIDTGAPEALVLFQRVKRSMGSGFDGVAVGTARVAPGGTQARRDPGDLFARPLPDAGTDGGEPLYGTGGVSVQDATAYFFACGADGCSVGRVPVARADQRAAFEFYDGAIWTTDVARARPVIRGIAGGLSVTFNPHLGRYLAVNSMPLSNTVLLRTADHVEGPWPVNGEEIQPEDGGVLAAVSGSTNYLAQEHVALRSADGAQIVISYARPTGPFRGEVRLARITLR